MTHTNLQRSLPYSLCASAFLLLALIILQLGRTPAAFADEAIVGRGNLSAATVKSGLLSGIPSMPDCLWVVDDRSEMLFIYYIENSANVRLQLRYSESLAKLFAQGRGR